MSSVNERFLQILAARALAYAIDRIVDGDLSVGNDADVIIRAKSSGPFAGIAISQHPDATLPSNTEHLITGGGEVEINGIVYFPTQPLRVTGGGVIGEMGRNDVDLDRLGLLMGGRTS